MWLPGLAAAALSFLGLAPLQNRVDEAVAIVQRSYERSAECRVVMDDGILEVLSDGIGVYARDMPWPTAVAYTEAGNPGLIFIDKDRRFNAHDLAHVLVHEASHLRDFSLTDVPGEGATAKQRARWRLYSEFKAQVAERRCLGHSWNDHR